MLEIPILGKFALDTPQTPVEPFYAPALVAHQYSYDDLEGRPLYWYLRISFFSVDSSYIDISIRKEMRNGMI